MKDEGMIIVIGNKTQNYTLNGWVREEMKAGRFGMNTNSCHHCTFKR